MREFERFCDRYHRHFTRDANACVALGVDRRLGELPDPSLAEVESVLDEARGLLHESEAPALQGLSFDDALDLDLARLELDAEIHRESYRWNDRSRLQQMPTAGSDVGDGVFLLLSNDPRPAAERLSDIRSRLERVPDYLESLLARLDTPIERWVKMDLEKVAGLPALLSSISTWAHEVEGVDREGIDRACEGAEKALSRYAGALGEMPTSRKIHVGDAIARQIVVSRGIDESLEDLHQIARDFLETKRSKLEELRGRLSEKLGLGASASIAEVEGELEKRFKLEIGDGDLEQVLTRYEEERERVLAFIRARDLFPIPEDQDMKIVRTPGFMTPSIPAGAMMSPPPFREGVRTSLIYLTLSEELLSEHTNLHIPSMMIHEGIPGHHLQLASASAHPSLIRRHVSAMDQAEGWTTMLEEYMLDIGYMGEFTDEARFCGLRDIARIGARVAIDLFFMTGERDHLEVGVDCEITSPDPFVVAGNLLEAVTGFVPGRVQAELNWYSQERGYPLSYLSGNHLVRELKRDVALAMKGRLEGLELDRVFHRAYLEAGNMPVRFLRRVFERQGLLSAGEPLNRDGVRGRRGGGARPR